MYWEHASLFKCWLWYFALTAMGNALLCILISRSTSSLHNTFFNNRIQRPGMKDFRQRKMWDTKVNSVRVEVFVEVRKSIVHAL